jgi:hypothetical protein
MPIGIHDARRLANLGPNQLQLLIGNLTYVDLDVQEIVRREFGADPPRNNIEVLETLNYARDRAGISVCDDSKPSPRIGWWRIHGTNAS